MMHRPGRSGAAFGAVILAVAVAAALAMALWEGPGPDRSGRATPAERVATASGSHCSQPGPYQLPSGRAPVHLDPADFTVRIDNPYWPMRPGTVWRYREEAEGQVQQVTVTVTSRTVRVEGISARVVHDVVREDGRVVEDTWDWYAQDAGGSLWYLGEDTRELDHGKVVSTEGSWRHGRDGAQAGVILPARPRPGCSYREEYLAGEAEDQALVLALSETVTTRTGLYRRVLHTANWTPVEPAVLENKLYARGVGPVIEIDLSPDPSRADLISVTLP
jgi:hypothetical protein